MKNFKGSFIFVRNLKDRKDKPHCPEIPTGEDTALYFSYFTRGLWGGQLKNILLKQIAEPQQTWSEHTPISRNGYKAAIANMFPGITIDSRGYFNCRTFWKQNFGIKERKIVKKPTALFEF